LAELKGLDIGVWHALGLLGVIALFVRGKRREALLLLGPLAVLITFNALGFWPLGAFRTNLFALLYAAGVAAAAVDRPGSEPDGWDLMPAGVLVVIPFLLLGKTTHATKSSMSADSAFPAAMQAVISLQRSEDITVKSLLALDNASCSPWKYYTRYHPDKSLSTELKGHFRAVCTKSLTDIVQVLRKGLKTPESRAYVLVSRARPMDDVEMNLPADLLIDGHAYVGQHDHLVMSVKKKP